MAIAAGTEPTAVGTVMNAAGTDAITVVIATVEPAFTFISASPARASIRPARGAIIVLACRAPTSAGVRTASSHTGSGTTPTSPITGRGNSAGRPIADRRIRMVHEERRIAPLFLCSYP